MGEKRIRQKEGTAVGSLCEEQKEEDQMHPMEDTSLKLSYSFQALLLATY